ncbi:DUF6361 family protein [Brevibacterium sp. CS2]|uniref:DUF6361 family protein n=1 Tax=Brevibacterium sp. CS2 TaxID=2575923 RepID=UPI0010C7D0FE|nr:DUF6361 family protein [Brevibacterium sp. CS2]QCP04584.1 hypothetical protein FDF13_04185 [Brevibacterium sp. CS2]
MSSMFGWIATDPEQRRSMMEAVDQFRDKSTIDDLGLGAIRDAFSDTLFPGTSTLHTRLRYSLFIPWLLELAREQDTIEHMQAAFRRSENQLMLALERGGESTGVVGRIARESLKRPASTVYWGMLVRWGIFERGFSYSEYFTRCRQQREILATTPRADDPEVTIQLPPTGLDVRLPPVPADLLRTTDFRLRPEDEHYLSESIARTTAGSLLSHLVYHRPESWTSPETAPESFADPAVRAGLPAELDALVSRAQNYAVAVHGANLLYNLVLAEKTGREDEKGDSYADHYRGRIAEWFDEVAALGTPTADDQKRIWTMVTALGRNITPRTIGFLESWFEHVNSARSHDELIDSPRARILIEDRELEKKGTRARLSPGNARALDGWSGASGIGRHEYRWSYAKVHLQDLYDARVRV